MINVALHYKTYHFLHSYPPDEHLPAQQLRQ
ncbi:hypothetical protein YPC_4233 [Yersinia pestis biovar Medievalis str. Harbin 35]|nr:hypothetical protein YPC_4233 [Yersinia pestis biovar Medievalis str. Harbin 35]EEO78024.1 hypothetical protein YP516_0235 [Yersinia pestis Nepal516]EEO82312.1 hypothetical protein YPF_0277 [Yersinia pestis biovar Orientalis str. India 195]EEO86279.1 hypothetical protein YPH_2193 [Yersinia pestis biovar Orientalis str. PEXU2]EEO92581.1 hypothetical protein YPS_0013 [Yersinia pestis Pestoides A]